MVLNYQSIMMGEMQAAAEEEEEGASRSVGGLIIMYFFFNCGKLLLAYISNSK